VPKTPVILLTGVLFDPAVINDRMGRKIAAYLGKIESLERIAQEVRTHIGA
jgi:hypothetical protein